MTTVPYVAHRTLTGRRVVPARGSEPSGTEERPGRPDLGRLAARGFATAVLLLASGAFFALRSSAEAEGPSPAILLLWLVFYGVAGLLLLDGALRKRRPVPMPLLLLALVAFAVMSVLWSFDPALTLRRGVGLGGTVLVGLALAQLLSSTDVLHALRRAMLIIALSSLLLYLSGSGLALDDATGTLRGVLSTKNALGRGMALGLLACVCLVLLDRRAVRRCGLSAVPMVLALGLTDSKAGLLVAVLTLVVGVVILLRRRTAGRVLLVAVAVLVTGGLALTAPMTTAGDVAAVVGEDTTLTGRDSIWAESAAAARERPWVGYGFGAFWSGTEEADRIRARLGWDVPHGHNGLVDVVLELGIVGALLSVAMLTALVARGVRDAQRGRHAVAALRLAIASIVIVSNIVESGLLQTNGLLTVLMVIAIAAPGQLAPSSGRRLEP